MATKPSRPVAKNGDLDLTPPEEIRARRIRRWIFLGTLGVCVLGVGVYFAAPSIGGAIEVWQSRRVAREAFALIDQRKWAEAVSKARDAYFLRPSEPQSWRAIARVASRTGQWAAALDWWKKVDEAHRLTLEDRRDFVGAALDVGDTPIAAQQVEILLAQRTGPEPHDILLAGQVSARQSDPVLALDYAERVLADKRTKPYDILSAATLVLSVTSPYSPPYASAWQQIEAVARDPKNPASLDALALLAQEKATAAHDPTHWQRVPFTRNCFDASSESCNSSTGGFRWRVCSHRRRWWSGASRVPWTPGLNQHLRRNWATNFLWSFALRRSPLQTERR